MIKVMIRDATWYKDPLNTGCLEFRVFIDDEETFAKIVKLWGNMFPFTNPIDMKFTEIIEKAIRELE